MAGGKAVQADRQSDGRAGMKRRMIRNEAPCIALSSALYIPDRDMRSRLQERHRFHQSAMG